MRLYLLTLGMIDMDRRVTMPASPPGERVQLPVPGYLIRGDGTTILVDTGMSREGLAGAGDFGGRLRPLGAGGAYGVGRLAGVGVRAGDGPHVAAPRFPLAHP